MVAGTPIGLLLSLTTVYPSATVGIVLNSDSDSLVLNSDGGSVIIEDEVT